MADTLTKAQRRALEAVRDGLCFRRYTAVGNTLHGPEGVSARTLWSLARARLVDDRPGDPASRCRLVLTMKARDFLSIQQRQEGGDG